MSKIIILFLAILSYVNAHNIATYSIPIPALTQWTPTNLPFRISSNGLRQDLFVQYLNIPSLTTTPLVAANLPIRGFSGQIATGVQLSVSNNIPSATNQVTSAVIPQNIQQSRPIQSSTGTVPLQFSPQPSNKIPINLNTPSSVVINSLGTQYITPIPVPTTRPTAVTNPNVNNNVNKPSQGIPFNVPSGNENFGNSLGPMFIEPTKQPANNNGQIIPPINNFLRPIIPNQNNDQTIPSNTFLPPIIPNQVPNIVPKLYETPIRGSDTVPNTNLYSPPSAGAGSSMQSQQLSKANGQSSRPSLNKIYTLNNIPLLLSY